MSTPGVVSQKDTTYTKIFVGGLPYHTTDKSLKEYFDKFGDIEEGVVITDRQTGKSRGYGFVTMSDREAAERACKDPNPIIDGRKANVNLAYLGAKPRGLQAGIPLAIKTGIQMYPSQYGYPQLIYPSSYMTSPGVLTAPVQPSPLSPVGQQYLDYSSAYVAAAAAGQLNNSLDAYQYTTAASPASYVAPTYGYTLPQQLTAGSTTAGHLNVAHYQPQQIPDRM